jgi:GT2 family glycosyltransferase
LVDNVIGAVIVVDQGTAKAKEHPGSRPPQPLGGRLSVYDQPNLGGSGGYSTVMLEALRNTACEQILFMDDDIRIEPDSILRALALSRFAKIPTLIGGQMLNLQEPSHLHVMGEVVDRSNFMWTNAPHTEYDHDFAKYPSTWKTARTTRTAVPSCCTGVSTSTTTAGGCASSAPVAENWAAAAVVHQVGRRRLRAAGRGARLPTVTMPGTAIWRMAWTTRTTPIDWQAYFHLRNRLVVSAPHWDAPVKGLIKSSLKATLKHLLCLEYSTVAIQNKAIDDSPGRPGAHLLDPGVGAARRCARLRQQFPTRWCCRGRRRCRAERPDHACTGRRWPCRPSAPDWPAGCSTSSGEADPAHHERPQLNAATQDARWFLLCNVDGVTVTTADGRACGLPPARPRQDGGAAESLTGASISGSARRYDHMRRVYRKALPELSSQRRSGSTAPLGESVGARLRPRAFPSGPIPAGSPAGEVAAAGRCAVSGWPTPATTAAAARAMSRLRRARRRPGWRLSGATAAPLDPGGAGATGSSSVSARSPPARRRHRRSTCLVRRRRPHHPDVAAVNVGSTELASSFPSGARHVQHRRGYAAQPGHPVALAAGRGSADGPVPAWCSVRRHPTERARRDGRRRQPSRRCTSRARRPPEGRGASMSCMATPTGPPKQPPHRASSRRSGADGSGVKNLLVFAVTAGRPRRRRHLRLPRRPLGWCSIAFGGVLHGRLRPSISPNDARLAS